jgi:hypothetical protein
MFQWEPGMTWSNYQDYWVVDHVLPMAGFTFSEPTAMRVCCSWFNLKPLTKEANNFKRVKLNLPDYMNTIVSATRFIRAGKAPTSEYEGLRESVAWLRATLSGIVTSSTDDVATTCDDVDLRRAKKKTLLAADEDTGSDDTEMGDPQPSS